MVALEVPHALPQAIGALANTVHSPTAPGTWNLQIKCRVLAACKVEGVAVAVEVALHVLAGTVLLEKVLQLQATFHCTKCHTCNPCSLVTFACYACICLLYTCTYCLYLCVGPHEEGHILMRLSRGFLVPSLSPLISTLADHPVTAWWVC